MEERSKNIITLVEQSFLSSKDKEALLREIEQQGISDGVMERINRVLIAELVRRGDLYEQVARKFDEAIDSIEEECLSRRSELEKELGQKLEGIDVLDLGKKSEIFDWYYGELELIRQTCRAGIDHIPHDITQMVIGAQEE